MWVITSLFFRGHLWSLITCIVLPGSSWSTSDQKYLYGFIGHAPSIDLANAHAHAHAFNGILSCYLYMLIELLSCYMYLYMLIELFIIPFVPSIAVNWIKSYLLMAI